MFVPIIPTIWRQVQLLWLWVVYLWGVCMWGVTAPESRCVCVLQSLTALHAPVVLHDT